MTDGSTRTATVRGHARVLAVLVGALMVLYWTFAGAEFYLASQISGAGITTGVLDTLRSVATVQASVALAYVVVALGMLLAAGLWVARAHANASMLSPGSQRFSRGLAAWCVVIPLGNLVLMPMVVADLWRASEPGRPAQERRPVGAVQAWTACAIASFVVFFGGNVLLLGSRSADVTPTVVQDVLLVVLGTATAVLFVRCVLRISGWQQDRTVQPT